MTVFKGKGVCGAVAIGEIQLFERSRVDVRRVTVEDTESEIRRFSAAKQLAAVQLDEIYRVTKKDIGEAEAAIFEIHIMLLDDEDYNEFIENEIVRQRVNAEYAVAQAAESFSQMFLAMDDEYMQARAADIKDISQRLIQNLAGADTSTEICERAVICADDLLPGETALLDKSRVLAFVTAHGSANSHTAILAKSMGIPAVIGVGDEFLRAVKNGDKAAVDGFTGEIYINPDGGTLALMTEKQREADKNRALLQSLINKESVTADGRKISIYANVGSIGGVKEALNCGADGIGLFRSEFLYLENSDFPTEEQQFAVYKKALTLMRGKRVIIRTADIGADKRADYFNLAQEENPALGYRAIRICLNRPDIFKPQLRALYRASVYGKLAIMFPMITSVTEVEKILDVCNEVKNELRAQGTEYSENVELGIMIETPAAAIISDKLAPLVDFFSVGTNDLTQYTLACDRQNPHIENFCDPHHEAVLRLIEMSAQNAHRHGAWIGICGELAADTSLTETFLKMGIDELSVSPPFVLELRDRVRKTDLSK